MSKKNAKKGNGGGNQDDVGMQERVSKNDGKVKSLQQILMSEQERADKCKASENEIRQRAFECEQDLKKEKEKTYSIVADMTRTYKQTQEQLQEKIHQLNQQIKQKEQIINERQEQIQALKIEFHSALSVRDDKISSLKQRIEDMSSEFAKMLKETLEKMQERIDFAQWDQQSDDNTVNRIKNIVGYSKNN